MGYSPWGCRVGHGNMTLSLHFKGISCCHKCMYYSMEELQLLSGTNSKDQHFNREESLIAKGVSGRSGNRKPSHPVPLPGQGRVWRGVGLPVFCEEKPAFISAKLGNLPGHVSEEGGWWWGSDTEKNCVICAGSFIFILFLKSQIILQDLEEKKRFLCPNPHRPQTHDLESRHQGTLSL